MSGTSRLSERIRTWIAAGIVVLLSCIVAGVMALFLLPDFSADVNRVFAVGPLLGGASGGMDFISDGGPGSFGAFDFAHGMRLAVLGLLAIGIPLGICGRAVRARNRWSALDPQSGVLFQFGFLFQLASLVLAAAGLLLMSFDGVEGYVAAPFFSLMLAGDVFIGAFALISWRALQERRCTVVLTE